MPEHPPSHPRQRDPFAKEDTPNLGRDVGEGIPHAPDNNVFKSGGLLNEGGPVASREEVSLVDQFLG